jgi:predicted transcriptional regulator
MNAANNRYLEFISAFDNKQAGYKRLQKVSQPKQVDDRNYKGFNFFSKDDLVILLAIVRGEFNIQGFRNKHLRNLLGFNSNKVSRILKRLWIHGLIKKTKNSYKYYITKLGKQSTIMAQKIKELIIVPQFCY